MVVEGNIGFKTNIGQAEFESHVCASNTLKLNSQHASFAIFIYNKFVHYYYLLCHKFMYYFNFYL